MQMTFRWYGEGNDSITPEMIRQIPGVTGLSGKWKRLKRYAVRLKARDFIWM